MCSASFYFSGTPGHGMVTPTFRVDLPALTSPVCISPSLSWSEVGFHGDLKTHQVGDQDEHHGGRAMAQTLQS